MEDSSATKTMTRSTFGRRADAQKITGVEGAVSQRIYPGSTAHSLMNGVTTQQQQVRAMIDKKLMVLAAEQE